MNTEQERVELLPCPFCGAGKTEVRENGRPWLGTRWGEPASVSVRHWCEPVDGQPSRMIERVGRDRAAAIAAWNRRAALQSQDYANILRTLAECRDIAMEWTMRGRIPECGKFGEIAQDLDAVCAELEREGWSHPTHRGECVNVAPQPAEPCASSVSDKTACGSENGDCDSQPVDPDSAKCAECGAELIQVRPGKWQHPDCSQSSWAADPVKVPSKTDYAELRAALEAVKPGDGDTMLAYRLASGPTVIRALLADHDAYRRQAQYETDVAHAAFERVKALEAERDALIHDKAEYVGAANDLATENQRLRVALEMIAGIRPCADVLMGNADIARAALAQEQGGRDAA